jgi:hypothetical protein
MSLLLFSDEILPLNRYVNYIFCLTNSVKRQKFRYEPQDSSLDVKQKQVILNILHQGGLIATGQAIHRPSMLQQMALGLGRLLTTYVTTFYTNYICKIDDLNSLEIVEVAYGGLAAGRGVISLRVRLWVSVLGVEIRNSLDFLWVFFFAFRYSRRYWLLL